MRRTPPVLLATLALTLSLSACGAGDHAGSVVPGGDANRAPELIDAYGCGSCHTIAGIDNATAKVGPRLDDLADRVYIAGHLPNTPETLIRWIMNPQAVEPGTVMPDMGVSRADARDIAAYLYDH
jgi:cytochrome c2